MRALYPSLKNTFPFFCPGINKDANYRTVVGGWVKDHKV